MIRNLLRKIIVWSIQTPGIRIIPNEPVEELDSPVNERLKQSGIKMEIYSAHGGTVIETTYYNDKKGENDHNLYVIPEGEDFVNTLNQIITLERLKS